MSLWSMTDSTLTTNTVSVDAGNTTVSTTNADFTAEVVAGDVIYINPEEHKVASVTNTTSLELETQHETGNTSTRASVSRKPTYLTITDARNTFGVDADEMTAATGDANTTFKTPQHAGWVLKKTKTRRYANNDTYTITHFETLVAAGSMSSDFEDDVFPDS